MEQQCILVTETAPRRRAGQEVPAGVWQLREPGRGPEQCGTYAPVPGGR